MDSGVAEEEKPEQTAASASSDTISEAGVLQSVQLLLTELYRLSYGRIRLAALETQRAGESLVTMIVAAVVVAFLLSSAWLGLMAAAILGMVNNGLPATSAILLAVAFNLVLSLILYGVIRHKSRYLQFPATLRCLQPRDSGHRVGKNHDSPKPK
jgi:hypothetical protein